VPTRLLSDPELDQLTSWPPEVAHSDLVEFFTLDLGDLRWLRTHAGAMNRLGLAIQLCALRYLGFIPGSLGAPPAELLAPGGQGRGSCTERAESLRDRCQCPGAPGARRGGDRALRLVHLRQG
jgi:hypothetical protein